MRRALVLLLSAFILSACGGGLADPDAKTVASQIKEEAELAKDVYCQKSIQARDRGFTYKCTVVRQDDSVTTVYR